MKYYLLRVLLLLCMPVLAAAEASSRMALVIGNEKYTDLNPLNCPARDAATVAAALRECQFTVKEHHDLNAKQLRQAISDFGKSLPEGGVAVVYFSGHGLQSGERNFLLPVDLTQDTLNRRAVSIQSVNDVLTEAGTAVNILILDCCRDGHQLPGREGFAPMSAPVNTVIAYATAPGTSANDGTPPGPGPYAAALARHIRAENVEIIEALRLAGDDVVKETDGEQRPWFNSDMNGRFYMNARSVTAGGSQKFEDGEMAVSALTFARHFLAADQENDPGAVLRFYAPVLDTYFGQTALPGSAVIEDRRKGIAKAPARRYVLEKAPAISRRDAEGRYTIVCERRVEWKDKDGKPQQRPSHIAFRIRPKQDGWEIFYITAHQPKRDALARKGGEAFDRAALEEFLIGFDSADEEEDPAAGMKFFAPQVTQYFDQKAPAPEAIRADREAHRKRWPVRTYRPQTYQVREVSGNTLRVTYTTAWRHQRGEEIKEGTASNLLTLEMKDGAFLVTAIESAPKE